MGLCLRPARSCMHCQEVLVAELLWLGRWLDKEVGRGWMRPFCAACCQGGEVPPHTWCGDWWPPGKQLRPGLI